MRSVEPTAGKGHTVCNGERSRDFKVLLKEPSCYEALKVKYRVRTHSGNIMVVNLTKEELEKISKEECVKYVEPATRLELKGGN